MAEQQSPMPPPPSTYEELAGMIEHSLVRPDLTDDEILTGCHVAREYGIAAVSVRPSDIDVAARTLGGGAVAISAVVGFPHGSSTTAAKLYEARDALRRGARELEVVINIGKMLSRQFQHVETELLQMAESCRESGALLKVNLELSYLANDLKIIACKILRRVEADFAVTSTCFGPSGFSPDDLILLRAHLKGLVKVKAAGGVRTLEKALEMRQAGCTRFGTTATVAILENWKSHLAQLAAAVSPESGGEP